MADDRPQYVIKRVEKSHDEEPPVVYFVIGFYADGVRPLWECDDWFETEQEARASIIGRGGEVLKVLRG